VNVFRKQCNPVYSQADVFDHHAGKYLGKKKMLGAMCE
jgi:hypothetical protein